MRKRTFLIIYFILICVPGLNAMNTYKNIFPFANGIDKDTIVSDGESYDISSFVKTTGCDIKITYSKGKVKGKRITQKVVYTCQGENYLNVEEDGDIKEGDKVQSGDNIETGDNSVAELTFPNGTIARIGPNTNFTIEDCGDFQEGSKFNAKYILGNVWAAVQHALGGDENLELDIDRAVIGVRGTKFCVESKIIGNDTAVILKTYERVVEFRQMFDQSEQAKIISDQTQKLFEDYNSGKITLDEFNRKIAEMGVGTYNTAIKYKVSVGAGFTSTLKGEGPPTAPVSFISDDNEWFLDKNFKGK